MSGTLAVALAVLVGAVALGAVGVVLQRGLAQVAEQLDQLRRHSPDVQRDLDQFWADLQHAEGQRATVVDKRLQGVETAVTQDRQTQDRLVQAVNWMLPFVQRWSDREEQR
jgi:hypothetical protein